MFVGGAHEMQAVANSCNRSTFIFKLSFDVNYWPDYYIFHFKVLIQKSELRIHRKQLDNKYECVDPTALPVLSNVLQPSLPGIVGKNKASRVDVTKAIWRCASALRFAKGSTQSRKRLGCCESVASWHGSQCVASSRGEAIHLFFLF